MRIIIDAMGGDHAPDEIVSGVLRAAKEIEAEYVLVGRGEEILKSLKKRGIDTLPKGVEIANAEDVVDMHDDPSTVIKKRRDSSMVIGLRMLAEGKGDAMISAGSTGALLTAATLIVKRLPTVRRAAMAPSIPTATGKPCILVDCGANADCTAEYLVQFACMGSCLSEGALGTKAPRVALLNIGSEDTKGTDLQRQAYSALDEISKQGVINFIGNIEARDVPLGEADVVVADGFSGNVLLKGIEGTAMFMMKQMKSLFKKNLKTKIAALLCKSGLSDMKKMLDYREVGGTPFLGISKPVIKAHGSSDALAIFNAIRQANEAVNADLSTKIEAKMRQLTLPKELEHVE